MPDVMDAVVSRRLRTFDHLEPAERRKEIETTRRAVVEYLDRPRPDFPPVEVRFLGREVPQHVTDAAFARARLARVRAQVPHASWPWLSALAAALPAELEQERRRIANGLPMPRRLGGEGDAMFAGARDRFPAGLLAPLVLNADG